MKNKIAELFFKPLTQLLFWILAAAIIVLGSLSADYVKNWSKDKSFRMPHLKKNIDRDLEVNERLRRLLLETNSDRAWVMFFHNGSATATGIPFKKVSNIYEAVRKGVSVEIQATQGLPISALPEVTDLLVKNPDIIEVWTSQCKDSTFKYLIEAQRIKYMLWHRILQNDNIIGFVGVDYLREPTSSLLSNKTYVGELNLTAHMLEYQFSKSMN